MATSTRTYQISIVFLVLVTAVLAVLLLGTPKPPAPPTPPCGGGGPCAVVPTVIQVHAKGDVTNPGVDSSQASVKIGGLVEWTGDPGVQFAVVLEKPSFCTITYTPSSARVETASCIVPKTPSTLQYYIFDHTGTANTYQPHPCNNCRLAVTQ